MGVQQPSAEPAAAGQLRLHNTALVLRALRDDGPLSRTDLARHTGLAKATVGTIVFDLTSMGVVVDGSIERAPRGRPSRPVELTGERFVALGVEANVDYVSAVAVDLTGRTILAEERPVQNPSPETLATLSREIAERLAGERRRLLGVAAAVPGLVDSTGGRVAYAPNLQWRDIDLAKILHDALPDDIAVTVDNDANCAALAEATHGAARGVPDVLYLTGTVGIGGGIVSGGAIVRGGFGYAGEVGHMRIGDPDRECGCGRLGCWESVIGLRAMLEAVGDPVPESGDPMAVAAEVSQRAASDERVRAGLTEVAEWLASGSAILANALNPSVIVLGG
ncbi:MAG: ROK family transcriptional regulator, partial [Actinomycetia bacterium]|nr:ROK family transcriptional regulator [Actinomycetes bacterium]